jgi:hypothetical protein
MRLRGGEVGSEMLRRAGEIVQEFIEREGQVECLKLEKICVNLEREDVLLEGQ